MKRILSAFAALLFVASLASCSLMFPNQPSPTSPPPKGMTPVETVQYYFAQWDTKNAAAMNGVVTSRMRSNNGLGNLKYVMLKKCDQRGIPGPDSDNPDIYQTAYVDVEFHMELKNDFSGPPSSNFTWTYTLEKATPTSNWMISNWGSG